MMMNGTKRVRGAIRGSTLVELLLVVAIILLVMVLLLPGIQAGREASHRAQCMNNQRQLALATLNYVEMHRVLPPGRIRSRTEGEGLGFSGFVQIFPFFEQSYLYSTLNFSRNAVYDRSEANETTRKTHVRTLMCPIDLVMDPSKPGNAPVSYVMNAGTGLGLTGNNGAFLENRALRFAEFTDGASTTALFSETLRSDQTPQRMMVALENAPIVNYEADCLPKTPNAAIRGWHWIYGAPGATFYTHHRPPNDSRPDCQGGNPRPDGDNAGWDMVTLNVAARSNHRGGVNVTFGDGHVAFVKQSVSLSIWQALGTRNGNEFGLDADY